MKQVLFTAVAAVGAVLSAGAANYSVSETASVFATAKKADGGDTVTAATADRTYPEGLPTPAYWLDAADRAAWTVDAAGNVLAVPSKTGSRVLASDSTGAWTAWGAGVAAIAPTLALDADLGAWCVDFGAVGSRKALFFDAAGSGGGTMKLSTVGTTFVVYGSKEGGGWIFGGTPDNPNGWKRSQTYCGTSGLLASPYAPLSFNNTVFESFYYGWTRHDGHPYANYRVGFNGGWEVFTFSPTNNEAAASLEISGFGASAAAVGGEATSGGLKIAEAIVFGEVLSKAQIEAVEAYLHQKWLGGTVAGDRGNAVLGRLDIVPPGTTAETTIEVPAGETLTIGELHGGHNKTGAASDDEKLNVTGAGTLILDDATRYGGEVILKGATLGFDRKRPVPTADRLPAGLVMRFDASVESTLTLSEEDTTNYVAKVTNLADQKNGANPIYLRQTKNKANAGVEDRRPWLVDGWSPTGLPMIEYGPWRSWAHVPDVSDKYYGRCLDIVSSPVLTTVIAVLDVSKGGGWLMNSAFCRGTQSGNECSTPLLCSQGPNHNGKGSNNTDKQNVISYSPEILGGDGIAYLDGERVAEPGKTGYGTDAKFRVVALQVGGCTPSLVGGYNEKVAGALAWGEILAWGHPLTEQEIRDASAYLTKKWLGRTLRGYVDADATDVPDIQTLIVDEPSTINVASGLTARVRSLTLNAPLVKTGEGTLLVENLSDAGVGTLEIRGGDVRSAAPIDMTALAAPAAKPSFHLDPMQTGDWFFQPDVGNAVLSVVDIANNFTAAGNNVNGPLLTTENAPAGMQVLDFGTYGSLGSKAFALTMKKPLSNIRSLYMVWRQKAGSGVFLLGSMSGAPYNGYIDFHREIAHSGVADNPSTVDGKLFNNNNCGAVIKNGEVRTNGVVVTATAFKPEDDTWYLIEVHTAGGGVHASAIGCDRGSSRAGGFLLGESLFYERELTAREKVATRNYLMKKWFAKSDAELTPLPPQEPTPTNLISRLVVDGVAAVTGETEVRHLVGEGVLKKTGDGELSVFDQSAFTGTVHVAAGNTYRVTGHQPSVEPSVPQTGLALWLDAGQGVVTNESGEVTAWNSVLDDGWKAVSAKGTHDKITVANHPLYEAEPLFDGRRIVNMRLYSCMRFFNPAGEWTSITNIKTVLWVFGSQNGGGFLLGGGDHLGTAYANDGKIKYYAWHRGGTNAGAYSSDALTSGSGFSHVYNYSSFLVNGVDAGSGRTMGLSGGWDLVSCRLQDARPAPADGLAYDGRIFANEDYRSRIGRQRLAELLIYTNRLTDAELQSVSAYLNIKWMLNNSVAGSSEGVSVVVDEGATFDCSTGEQHLGALAGEGTVEGDVTSNGLVADAQGAGLTVDGTFTIREGVAVELKNVPGNLSGQLDIPILAATDYVGAENLGSAVFTGEPVPTGFKASLRIVNGVLVVRLKPAGMMLLVR